MSDVSVAPSIVHTDNELYAQVSGSEWQRPMNSSHIAVLS